MFCGRECLVSAVIQAFGKWVGVGWRVGGEKRESYKDNEICQLSFSCIDTYRRLMKRWGPLTNKYCEIQSVSLVAYTEALIFCGGRTEKKSQDQTQDFKESRFFNPGLKLRIQLQRWLFGGGKSILLKSESWLGKLGTRVDEWPWTFWRLP